MANAYEQRSSESILYRVTVANDTITDSLWSISPSGPEIYKQEQTATDTTAMVSGLEPNTKYKLSVLVSCQSGQVIERTVTIRCNAS